MYRNSQSVLSITLLKFWDQDHSLLACLHSHKNPWTWQNFTCQLFGFLFCPLPHSWTPYTVPFALHPFVETAENSPSFFFFWCRYFLGFGFPIWSNGLQLWDFCIFRMYFRHDFGNSFWYFWSGFQYRFTFQFLRMGVRRYYRPVTHILNFITRMLV